MKNNNVEGLYTVTMTKLYDTVYPPQIPIIDNFLYTGMYLFVGAPKIGKSFYMLQLGYHVATGKPLWGNPVHQATVLYLALEDTYSRLQSRLSCMFGVESADNLYFTTKSQFLNTGLDQQLEMFIKEHPDTKLVIIDTLQKVRDLGKDNYSYSMDYESVAKLKTFADKHNICILAVHHTRKMDSSDIFDLISGTNGLLGAADAAFVVQKQNRTEPEATMDVTGRDQQDMRYKMKFDSEHHVWKLLESEPALLKPPADPLLEAINKFLSENEPEWEGTATELLQRLPISLEIKANVLTRKLNIANSELYIKYHIYYETKHLRERIIILKRIQPE
ncbi:MAG: helicase RepA family protein [Candidatus Gastranaerophilales bacterium]|nr:helicase RepA family protein [Candidatus Gastranaerophilales bacterium]